jgi:hypothetical protein
LGRTVSFTQQGEPEWFSVGQRWKELTADLPPLDAADQLGLAPAEIRTAQRWARAAEFVSRTYPTQVASASGIKAGVVAVLELAKLHRLDPQAADAMAERLLSGALTTADVKREVAAALDGSKRNRTLRARSSSVWRAAFRRMAIGQILNDRRLLRSIGSLAAVHGKPDRAAYEPDLVALFERPRREVGIIVRAPRETAAKSVASVAVDLLSDIALMMLRYETVLAVVPLQARNTAMLTLERWYECAGPEVRKSRRIYFLLLDEQRDELLQSLRE